MNLLCAHGLPGAERLEIAGSLAAIDQMAARVCSETERAPKIVRYHRLN